MGKQPREIGKQPSEPDSPRAKAEAKLARASGIEAIHRTAEELLHELRVHQIELEIQN